MEEYTHADRDVRDRDERDRDGKRDRGTGRDRDNLQGFSRSLYSKIWGFILTTVTICTFEQTGESLFGNLLLEEVT